MNLRLVQAQAIVLADGRRVYFLKNGEQAKDESGRLLEGRDLDEARRIREQRQDAATYEAYQESCREYRSVAGEKARLEAYWQKWRDLNEDVRAGRISGEALKRRQAELLDELDPEDREAILRARPERRRLYEEYKDEHRFADDKRGMRAEAGFAVGEDAVGGMAARARSLEESLNALDAALDRPAPARQIAALRLEN